MAKVALVTGGSRGIGRAICERLAADGFSVAINYVGNEAAAKETLAACEQAAAFKAPAACEAATFATYAADVSDTEQANALLNKVTEEMGEIVVLVNNAGITRDGLIMRMSVDDFDAVLNVNLRAAFNLCKGVSRSMSKQRAGRIINISSVVGLYGNAGQANYAASKAALIGLTKSLAKELGSRQVTVNAVCPGFIRTDMTDALSESQQASMLAQIALQRPGEAKDVAAAVSFLASEDAAYISGQTIVVDGCMSL
ncbi:MAG: 3-oxoacyl-[acyl-carrier-protein] reductase [Coriobacteriales bacterium]|nr:3-oxoacyl-[acyl-carrier-protein] reductase [Coriobacteriales bacterium]